MPQQADNALIPVPEPVLRLSDRLFGAMREGSGSDPELTGPELYRDDHFFLTDQGFDFATPGGVRFTYRCNDTVKVRPVGPELVDEKQLYLWGTVFGAVGWLNGMIPLHASAVGENRRAIAFTGYSGAGKSTMAAALAQRGFTHICDDTLVLGEAGGHFFGLPDSKPIKLWDDAVSALETGSVRPITTVPGKNYADARNAAKEPMPLTDLVLLEEGEKLALVPVEGSTKLEALAASFYRGFIHAALSGNEEHASLMFRLAHKIRIWKLIRPRSLKIRTGDFHEVSELLRHRLNHL